MFVRKNRSLLFVLILVGLFFSCQDEEQDPEVVTLEPVIVDNTTVQLKAYFRTLPTVGEEYGFVWDGLKEPDYSKYRVRFNTPPSSNEIVGELSDLTIGKEYYVRAYLIRESTILYGEEVSFIFGGFTPEISKLIPDAAHRGDTIQVIGKNFSRARSALVLQFGDLLSTITYATQDTIECIVPADLKPGTHTVKIKVAKNSSAGVVFSLLKPQILDFSPSTAAFLDLVVIQGTNFHQIPSNNKVRFGSVNAEVVQATKESITVRVPINLSENNSTISVQVDSQRVNAINPFILLPASMNSLEPNSGRIGNIITITGTNFNPSVHHNEVFFGKNRSLVVEATTTALKVQVPNGIYDDRIVSVSVKVAALTHQKTFTIKNAWIQKADIPSGMFGRFGGQGFVLNGIGYAGLGAGAGVSSPYADFYRFDDQTNSWIRIADYAGGRRFWAASFVIDGIAYVGTGSKGTGEGTNDFYKYNPQTNLWTRIADFPGAPATRATGFSVNGKGYLCLQTSSDNFWEYDPTLNVWINKTAVAAPPFGSVVKAVGAFVLENRAFVIAPVYGASELFEYDFVNDVWITKNDINGLSGDLPAIVATDSHAYYIFNYNALEYDIDDDSWRAVDFDPVPSRNDAFIFSIGEKIFLGGGRENSYKDFWECDTTKL